MVTLHTNHGNIVIRLFADKAPKTVENFLRYAREGHYDNALFHRVIDGFMIQGGGFGPGMRQKPTHEPIMNEADNGLRNTVGTVAMARTSDPHSATSAVLYQRRQQHPHEPYFKDSAGVGLLRIREGQERHGRCQQN